jgi:hypothetical protein
MMNSTKPGTIGGMTSMIQPEFLREGRTNGTRHHLLSYLVNSSIGRNVTEPVDRVYAVLGLADPVIRAKITVDYSLDCRRDYWKLYLAVGHLMIHEDSDAGTLLKVTTPDRPVQLPSWCPNFNSMPINTLPTRSHSIDGMTPVRRSASYVSTSADGMRINLQLCTIDEIKEVNSFAYSISPGVHRGLDGNCSRMLNWIADCHALMGRELPEFATSEHLC